MSTELTSSRVTDLPMVESRSLSVAFLLSEVRDTLLTKLAEHLAERGHHGVTGAALSFLGQLDCGINYASGVAQRLGVSRQMIMKTAGEMEKRGWIVQSVDPERRNRKVIRFTGEGERLMSDARQALAELDACMEARCGPGFVDDIAEKLERFRTCLDDEGA